MKADWTWNFTQAYFSSLFMEKRFPGILNRKYLLRLGKIMKIYLNFLPLSEYFLIKDISQLSLSLLCKQHWGYFSIEILFWSILKPVRFVAEGHITRELLQEPTALCKYESIFQIIPDHQFTLSQKKFLKDTLSRFWKVLSLERV